MSKEEKAETSEAEKERIKRKRKLTPFGSTYELHNIILVQRCYFGSSNFISFLVQDDYLFRRHYCL